MKKTKTLTILALGGFAFLLGDVLYDVFTQALNWRVVVRLIIVVIGFVLSIYALWS